VTDASEPRRPGVDGGEAETATATRRVRRTGAQLGVYLRRLLTPPLPGDGLLLVGLIEGVLGWGASALLFRTPSLAPLGVVASIVALWVVLTAGIVVVGVVYTAPTVRRRRVWVVWAVLNVAATAVNVVAVAGVGPSGLAVYGLYHPWLAVMGLGYLATALVNAGSPQLRGRERVAYAVGGVAALLTLAVAVSSPSLVLARPFLLGGLLHVGPLAYDVFADVYLLVRRTAGGP